MKSYDFQSQGYLYTSRATQIEGVFSHKTCNRTNKKLTEQIIRIKIIFLVTITECKCFCQTFPNEKY